MKTDLLSFPARICFTAAGCLIHQEKVLLVKHKKLGFWLCPGGHVEDNELPHQTAEREFWEETGVKVKAVDLSLLESVDHTQYLPNPLASNLHWVCKDNYDHRVNDAPLSAEQAKRWSKGCEQHLGLVYLVEPAAESVEFFENVEETDGIQWFAESELAPFGIKPSILQEVCLAFDLRRQLDGAAPSATV